MRGRVIGVIAAVLLACAPTPEPASLPPPPEAAVVPHCPGRRPRCLSREVCVVDKDRNCRVCACKPGFDPDRRDDQRGDPRWIYEDRD